MTSLAKTLDDLSQTLRTRHADEIRSDPKGFRQAVLAGISRRFRIRPGPKPKPELDEAERLRARGYTWEHIARILEPDYPNWGQFRRMQYRNTLQAGLRGRRKKRAAELQRESMPANVISAGPDEMDTLC